MHNLALRIPPAILFIVLVIMMWLSSKSFSLLSWVIPFHIIIAALLATLGVGLGLAGALLFHRVGTTANPMKPALASSLVTTGIYRFSRNPMYLGLAIILFGWGIYLSNILSLLLVIIFILYMNRFQIEPEEKTLHKLFGVQFEHYKRSVRRWM